MSLTLKDFLANRKAEIKTQQVALRKELAEISAAETAIESSCNGEDATTRKRVSSRLTIKDMIIGVLENKIEGADAFKILEMIKEKYGKDISRPSLSPQLSRLKTDDGVLELDGNNWRLVEKPLQKESAPARGADMVGEPEPLS
jgi:hypothetical protein